MNKMEGQVRIPSGCAIAAVISKEGKRMAGDMIINGMKPMHDRSNGLGGGFAWNGEGFIMLSTLSSALGSIISRQVSQGQDPVVVTGYQLTGGGLVLMLLGIAGHGQFGMVTMEGVTLLLYMAFLSAAAFTGWTMLLKYNPASRIAVYNFLIPVFGTAFSVMFLGESIFNLRSLLALILACAGIYIVNKEPRSD